MVFAAGVQAKKGLSIAEYVRKRRLHEAATLLCASELPIIDIALKYGFSSQQTFSRVFRAHFNTSPAKFRDQRLYPKLDEVMEMNKNTEMKEWPSKRRLIP